MMADDRIHQQAGEGSIQIGRARDVYIGAPVQPHAAGSAPPPPALFVGRDQALRDLKERLGLWPGLPRTPAAPVQVMTAVRGWPGVGKTTLAAALAHDEDVATALPDGVLWVALGPDPDVMTGLADWGRALSVDLADYTTPEARSTRLAHLLRNQRRLLIVDDVWPDKHDQPTTARYFCIGGRGCRTLVTTRHADQARALVGRADAVYRLGVLDDDAARELLVKLAGPAVDTPALGELIRALDGLPLALTVAGRLLAAEAEMGWDLDDLLTELNQRARILEEQTSETRLGLLPDVPLTVTAIFQLSTGRLPSEDRTRFALLGAFAPKPATWDTAAAAAVWETEDARSALRLLVDRGLVEPLSESRFHLHALLTEHARVLAGPSLEAAADRHARHYLSVAQAIQEAQQYLSLDPDWPQLRAAMEYSYIDLPPHLVCEEENRSGGRSLLFSDLALAVWEYLSVRGLAREAVIWLKRAAVASYVLGDRYSRGAHLTHLGNVYADLSDYGSAIEAYEQALVIVREIGDQHGEGALLNNLGLTYAALGDACRAIDYQQQALDIAREIGDRRDESSVLGSLSIAYTDLGNYDQAVDCCQQGLDIAREIGDRHCEGNHLGNWGNACHHLGDTRRAIECYQQALVIDREFGDRRGEANHLGNLGVAYAALGHYDQAVETYQQALAITHEIGDRRGEGNHLGNLGTTHHYLGNYEQAIDHYEQALTIAREIGDQIEIARHCWNLGLLYAEQGDRNRAAELMQVRVDYERDIGHLDAEKHAAYVARLREGQSGVRPDSVRAPQD